MGTTLGNDPELHFIKDGRFVCVGDRNARCHNYPACECETWEATMHGHGSEPAEAGHEDVAHDLCWMGEWINANSHLCPRTTRAT